MYNKIVMNGRLSENGINLFNRRLHIACCNTHLGARVTCCNGGQFTLDAPQFQDMPKVVNGESDLLVQLWGERGQHARAAVGVASLSREAPVETEMIVEVR